MRGTLIQEVSFGHSRQPTVPLGPRGDDFGQEARGKTSEGECDGVFTLVRRAHRLEPNGGPIGLKANQAERWGGIELSKPAAKPKALGTDLILYPAPKLVEPAQGCERSAVPVLHR